MNKQSYAAGIIDGEGSIGLSKMHKSQHRSPSISVSSTTPEILEFFKSNWGGAICKHKKYKKHHKQAFSWRLSYDAAIKFLEEIVQYLLVPEKKYRAELIVNEYKSIAVRNGKYTEEQLAKRSDFEKRFFAAL